MHGLGERVEAATTTKGTDTFAVVWFVSISNSWSDKSGLLLQVEIFGRGSALHLDLSHLDPNLPSSCYRLRQTVAVDCFI